MEKNIDPQEAYTPFNLPFDTLIPQLPIALRRNWFGMQRSRHNRIIMPPSAVGLVEVSGQELFNNDTDLTLTLTSLVSGYVRRSYIHTQAGSWGGINGSAAFCGTAFIYKWTSAAWARLASRASIFGDNVGYYPCTMAVRSPDNSVHYGYYGANVCTGAYEGWYYFTKTPETAIGISPSTNYALGQCTKDFAVYRQKIGGDRSDLRRLSSPCPCETGAGNFEDNSVWRVRCDVIDFGTDTRTAVKKTADTAPSDIAKAKLTPSTEGYLGSSGGTNVYSVSRDDGATWFVVTPDTWYGFAGAEAVKNKFKFKVAIGQNDRGSSKSLGTLDWAYMY